MTGEAGQGRAVTAHHCSASHSAGSVRLPAGGGMPRTAVSRERIRQPDSTVLSWPAVLGDDALADTWTDAWALLGSPPPAGLRQALELAWYEPQRRYHGLEHLRECLALLGRWRALASRPAEVTLALWFHDAVYVVD